MNCSWSCDEGGGSAGMPPQALSATSPTRPTAAANEIVRHDRRIVAPAHVATPMPQLEVRVRAEAARTRMLAPEPETFQLPMTFGDATVIGSQPRQAPRHNAVSRTSPFRHGTDSCRWTSRPLWTIDPGIPLAGQPSAPIARVSPFRREPGPSGAAVEPVPKHRRAAHRPGRRRTGAWSAQMSASPPCRHRFQGDAHRSR